MTKAHIIHLERAKARRPQVEALRKAIKLESEIVPAVDGSLVSQSTLAEVYRRQIFRPRYPFPLRPGEIGCFLSHRICWQKIVDSNAPGAFIFEDDVELIAPAEFADFMPDIEEIAGIVAYVRLPVSSNRDSGNSVHKRIGLEIVRPVTPGGRTQGQYVGRQAASTLLEATRQFDRPVDTFLQMPFLHKVKVLAVLPPVISEVSAQLGDTLIHRKKGIMDVLHREAARPVYRLRVDRLNRRWESDR
jgi:GR25 family glycosyltransferase involved in LPS biosynthesis